MTLPADTPPVARPAWAGWRTRLMALLAGIAAALAHPPFGLLPGLLGYGALMLLVDGASQERPLRSAFLRGWLAGLGYFAVGTWWVSEAFLVDIAAHGWMAPIAVTLMAGGIALFWGLAAWLYRLARFDGPWRVIVFAGAFGAAEWLRGHVLTGFPWNLPGETWRAGSAISQMASVVGVYGLTVLTVGVAAAPALLLPDRRRGSLIAVSMAAVVLLGMAGYGLARTVNAPVSPGGADAPVIRIVQPDVPQTVKYDPIVFSRILAKHLKLTRQPGRQTPDIVIWSEGAIPMLANDYLDPDSFERTAITQALAPGQVLLVGAAVAEPPENGGPVRYFNSLLALRRDGDDLTLIGRYDKHRLVPFGEFLPLEGLLSPLGFKELVKIGDGFTTGPKPAPMTLPGLPILQPLICYESLYPGFTREGANASGLQPRLLVNVSNDAWFGATSGPLQHLNLAAYRAIEEGVPMARATPTGVSAMIDAYGRVIPSARIEQGAEGVIDVALPPTVDKTPYRRLGDTIFFLFMIVSVGLTLVFHWRRMKIPPKLFRRA